MCVREREKKKHFVVLCTLLINYIWTWIYGQKKEEMAIKYILFLLFDPFFLRNRDVHTIAFTIYVYKYIYPSNIDFCVLNWFAHYYIYFYLFVYFIYCYFFRFSFFVLFFCCLSSLNVQFHFFPGWFVFSCFGIQQYTYWYRKGKKSVS